VFLKLATVVCNIYVGREARWPHDWSALVYSGASVPGSSTGQGHCVVCGKTLYSHSTSLHVHAGV